MKHFPTACRIMILMGVVVLAGLVWLTWSSQVHAQPPIPHSLEGRENCLACHETGVAGAPQYPEDHAGRPNSSCQACHAEMETTGNGAPPIPHELEGRDNCLMCHQDGVGGAPQVPADHEGRTNEMCQGCHAAALDSVSAPDIPHTLEGREDCTACHSPAPAGDAGAVAQPTMTPIPMPVATPLAYPEPEGEVNTCLECHLDDAELEPMAKDWQSSIHAERGVICADCHGGDPSAEDPREAKSPDAGYIGTPDRTEIPDLCGACHANVTLMRQYDLPTDQLAKYRESLHGQRLAEGDVKVATCYDCHDGHATHETNDPRASVYRLNVPDLCAGCHADDDYMAEYEIPTDQFALYQESVHGIALLDNQDTRAPSCATCHGTHGAAPPGFAEVANVCGSCHDATQNYYLSSAHNSDNPAAPRCVTCHGRYDVQTPSEAMFLGDEPGHCGSCHKPDSETGKVVAALYQALVDADESFEQAERELERTADLGMIVAEEESLLAEAHTKLITARAAQHAVSLDAVQEESDISVELSEQVRQDAEDAIAESRFRRQAMVVALGVIGLVIFSLVLLRRELMTSRHAQDEG